MESALSSLILFSVGIFAALTISHSYLDAQDHLWAGEQLRQTETLARAQTSLAVIDATTQSNGALVSVQIRNTGQTKLADFERWDLVVQYYTEPDYYVEPRGPEQYVYKVGWLPYTAGVLENQTWTVSGIYLNAATLEPEVFEPGILNPDEEMVIRAKLWPTVAMTTTNYITIGSDNGIQVSAHFQR
jgi:hypothetical protein